MTIDMKIYKYIQYERAGENRLENRKWKKESK